jgi:hypothetical protein
VGALARGLYLTPFQLRGQRPKSVHNSADGVSRMNGIIESIVCEMADWKSRPEGS